PPRAARADRPRRALDRTPADRGVHAGGERVRGARTRPPEAAAPPPRPRAAEPGERHGARAIRRGLRPPTPSRRGTGRAEGVRGAPRTGRGPARSAARQHRPPPLDAAGTLRRRAPRPLRPRDRRLHALHLADPALSRPRGAPDPRRRAHRHAPGADGSGGHRRGVLAPRARRDGGGARDRPVEEDPVHAGQGGRDVRGFRLGRRPVRVLRRAPRRVRRRARPPERARRRLLRPPRARAHASRASDAADVPPRRSRPRDGRGRVRRAPADRLHARGHDRTETGTMAKPTALLIALLLLPAARVAARGAESDPARRSLVVDAVEKASPAVVNVSTEVIEERGSAFGFQRDPFFDEFFRDFVDPRPQRYKSTSLGSGVIVGADGTIITNVHVVVRATRIHVTLADQREFDATLVGADADSDIAILRVKAGGSLPAIPLGSSSDLMIGETVIAIGNPFGLSHTVTTGVVSAVGRSLRDEERTYTDFIQTDASINPGNSGGPLLNIRGELVGINTAIYGKAQGIGFAIPVDRARRGMKDLVSYGEVRRAWVGLVVQDLTPQLARHFGTRKGVVVAEVEPDSPASRAGLARGDAITRVDGHDVHSRDEFEQRIQDHTEGQSIRLTRRREDGEDEVAVVAA